MSESFFEPHRFDLLQLSISSGQLTIEQLSRLQPGMLDLLRIKASALRQRAISDARDYLDVVLVTLGQSLPLEQQRRLLECADDQLASAQHWNDLAANARFCREHPELAKQLVCDATPSTEPAIAPHEELTPRRANRKNAAGG
ncbi:hypothetical protein J5226_07955 [Lysobacter sp. K5869]|uniref:hypothetical protein n=1 Tax=Lysobacter sp. K5869 TaxID=2820808 RepID=UPI001C063A75|nr:hypothetical protein [Lysobacter sp. K5869]QWP78314.1 hypothetical protein J5226_07955 [Lysobacter sp. K5869]